MGGNQALASLHIGEINNAILERNESITQAVSIQEIHPYSQNTIPLFDEQASYNLKDEDKIASKLIYKYFPG
ncbi:hypothetical protein Mpal_1165 [Methanosphaerula palustris E1-9c]|uniref:Uncharacterized protein n=1 Tax=Methanosphaerula palustris (strain ATCC BAA-1556 / DSM 19958 / E1-9c) TaxID=521011 RepID=B8GHA3_METPE|nr:hypothetical protein Mpal_1165 [Methanosphaerula palustris E1-9c]